MKDIKGKCEMCGTEYTIQKFYLDENPYFSGYEYYPCPKCEFNPKMIKDIETIINKEYTIVIANDKCKINSKELAVLIKAKIKEYYDEVHKKC